jgi:hypothetical protein
VGLLQVIWLVYFRRVVVVRLLLVGVWLRVWRLRRGVWRHVGARCEGARGCIRMHISRHGWGLKRGLRHLRALRGVHTDSRQPARQAKRIWCLPEARSAGCFAGWPRSLGTRLCHHCYLVRPLEVLFTWTTRASWTYISGFPGRELPVLNGAAGARRRHYRLAAYLVEMVGPKRG